MTKEELWSLEATEKKNLQCASLQPIVCEYDEVVIEGANIVRVQQINRVFEVVEGTLKRTKDTAIELQDIASSLVMGCD